MSLILQFFATHFWLLVTVFNIKYFLTVILLKHGYFSKVNKLTLFAVRFSLLLVIWNLNSSVFGTNQSYKMGLTQ